MKVVCTRCGYSLKMSPYGRKMMLRSGKNFYNCFKRGCKGKMYYG